MIVRNEKTGKFESAKNFNNDVELKEKEKFATESGELEYGFYSKRLQKAFDSLEDLRAAEQAVIAEAEAKKRAAEAKKAEASKVEEAYKSLNSVKRAYNDGLIEAKKAYLAVLQTAREKYETTLKTLNASLEAAQKCYDEALAEFTKAHPEGFHITLKDRDNVSTISRSGNIKDADVFENLFDFIFKSFN